MSSHTASAQPRVGSFGFGVILGEPTGLTLKGSAGGTNAWDFAIGPSWFGRIRLHGDYLWAANAFNSRKAGMYFGIGAVVAIGRGNGVLYHGHGGEWYYFADDNGVGFGARVAVGINAMPFTAPIELFGEVAPVLGLSPAVGFGLDAAIGIRFYP